MRENLSSPWLGRFARGGWLSGGRERAETERIAQAFAADLLRLSTPVGALSGGNQQKVAVGRWLGIEPEIMLLEEPTRGVDIGARAEIYQSLRRICDQGVGVVVASSDSSEILGLCDWIGTFYRGRMTDFRPRRQWTAEEMALQVMHGVREVA
jgi:ABC-type branched-subunit amino acid transport system ATPase component